MKQIENMILKMKNFKFTKIDPNFILLLLVIAFFVLLLATENVVKQTFIP
jgi:hypothetical protein